MVRMILLLSVTTFFLQTEGVSQIRHQRAQGGQERLETLRQVKMIESLELDEETAARLSVLYREHQQKNRSILQELDRLIDALETAIERGAPDAELQTIMSQIEEQRTLHHENRIQFYNNVERFLSPRQVAALVVFERNFQRDVRRLMQEAQRERRWRR